MKRLLCLVNSMDAGGAETFLMKIYRNLDKSKFQMDFGVYIDKKCFYDDEIMSMGGKIFHLVPKTKNLSEYKKCLYDLVKNEGFEYVLRITSNAAGFYDLKIAKEAGAKVCIARSSNSSDGGGIKLNLINLVCRYLYMKYVDIKIAPSDLAAKYTFGKDAVKNGEIHFLRNGLNLNFYKYSETDNINIHKEFDIDGKLVIGHIGRFSKQKNHEFLIKIFKEIKARRNDAVLILIGVGELKEDIENQIKYLGLENSVIQTGTRRDIPALLSAMDILVFPSYFEGMPNTILEAQANGLPCIISDSITKEVKITDLVKFVELNKSPSDWACCALDSIRKGSKEKEYFDDMRNAGYDIEGIVKEFTNIIFNI